MNNDTPLADLLEQYMTDRNVGDARLATLANEVMRQPNYIHRSTIRNWRGGTSKTVKDWRQLVAIAGALRLNEETATQLLVAGGCPSIRDLRVMATDEEKHLFTGWIETPKAAEMEEEVDDEPVAKSSSSVAAVAEHQGADNKDVDAQVDSSRAPISGASLTFRIATISAMTALALIVALGFLWNQPPASPAPPSSDPPSPAATVLAVVAPTQNESRAESLTHSPTTDPNSSFITIYDDALQSSWGWQERSSNTEVKEQSTEFVYAGEFALCATIQEYGALAFSTTEPLSVTPDHHIEFQIHGTEAAHGDLVFFVNNGDGPEGHTLTTIDLAGNYIEGGRVDGFSWRAVSIPLRDVGFDGEIVKTLTEINIHSAYAGEAPTIFLDDIQIVDPAHARKISNPADGRYIIYREQMHSEWSWNHASWNAAIDDADTGKAYTGEFAIKVAFEEFGLLGFFTAPPIPIEPEQWLEFHILGEDPGGQQLVLSVDNDHDFDNNASQRVDLYDNQYIEESGSVDHVQWRKIRVPLSDFEIDGNPVTEISLIMIHSPFQGETPTFWIDDVQIVSGL